MIKSYFYPTLILLLALFILGCYTQLGLVERDEYYYSSDNEADSVIVEEYYADSWFGYPSNYDYCAYWNPYWYSPRWGLFVGFYPYYGWRYFSPYYGGWWYYDYYYSYYWYGNQYVHFGRRGFRRRDFNRRLVSRYPDHHSRIAKRSRGEVLAENNRVIVRRSDSRNSTRPSIRNERTRRRVIIRQQNSERRVSSSTSRRPSFSGRSSSGIRSSNRGSISRGNRNSRSTRSSSGRPSRR